MTEQLNKQQPKEKCVHRSERYYAMRASARAMGQAYYRALKTRRIGFR